MRTRELVLYATFAFMSWTVSRAQEEESAIAGSGADFRDYELIVQRNIFDSQRTPWHAASEARAAEPTTSTALTTTSLTARRAETADLLGTWITKNQSVAFIEGNRPEFTGTPGVGGEIGGWRIAAVQTGNIELERDGERIVWPVGHRIERNIEENWRLAGRAEPRATSGASTSTLSSSAAARTTGSGSTGDILQRLRERRQRETQ